jgi:hypothetical protein
MAGCFGGSAEYRHFERQLMDHLDDSHHPSCACHEDNENTEEQLDDDGNYTHPVCTCDELAEEDEVDAKLSRMDI